MSLKRTNYPSTLPLQHQKPLSSPPQSLHNRTLETTLLNPHQNRRRRPRARHCHRPSQCPPPRSLIARRATDVQTRLHNASVNPAQPCQDDTARRQLHRRLIPRIEQRMRARRRALAKPERAVEFPVAAAPVVIWARGVVAIGSSRWEGHVSEEAEADDEAVAALAAKGGAVAHFFSGREEHAFAARGFDGPGVPVVNTSGAVEDAVFADGVAVGHASFEGNGAFV